MGACHSEIDDTKWSPNQTENAGRNTQAKKGARSKKTKNERSVAHKTKSVSRKSGVAGDKVSTVSRQSKTRRRPKIAENSPAVLRYPSDRGRLARSGSQSLQSPLPEDSADESTNHDDVTVDVSNSRSSSAAGETPRAETTETPHTQTSGTMQEPSEGDRTTIELEFLRMASAETYRQPQGPADSDTMSVTTHNSVTSYAPSLHHPRPMRFDRENHTQNLEDAMTAYGAMSYAGGSGVGDSAQSSPLNSPPPPSDHHRMSMSVSSVASSRTRGSGVQQRADRYQHELARDSAPPAPSSERPPPGIGASPFKKRVNLFEMWDDAQKGRPSGGSSVMHDPEVPQHTYRRARQSYENALYRDSHSYASSYAASEFEAASQISSVPPIHGHTAASHSDKENMSSTASLYGAMSLPMSGPSKQRKDSTVAVAPPRPQNPLSDRQFHANAEYDRNLAREVLHDGHTHDSAIGMQKGGTTSSNRFDNRKRNSGGIAQKSSAQRHPPKTEDWMEKLQGHHSRVSA